MEPTMNTTVVNLFTEHDKLLALRVNTSQFDLDGGSYPVIQLASVTWYGTWSQLRELHHALGLFLAAFPSEVDMKAAPPTEVYPQPPAPNSAQPLA
jgi:hypothetical protein